MERPRVPQQERGEPGSALRCVLQHDTRPARHRTHMRLLGSVQPSNRSSSSSSSHSGWNGGRSPRPHRRPCCRHTNSTNSSRSSRSRTSSSTSRKSREALAGPQTWHSLTAVRSCCHNLGAKEGLLRRVDYKYKHRSTPRRSFSGSRSGSRCELGHATRACCWPDASGGEERVRSEMHVPYHVHD